MRKEKCKIIISVLVIFIFFLFAFRGIIIRNKEENYNKTIYTITIDSTSIELDNINKEIETSDYILFTDKLGDTIKIPVDSIQEFCTIHQGRTECE